MSLHIVVAKLKAEYANGDKDLLCVAESNKHQFMSDLIATCKANDITINPEKVGEYLFGKNPKSSKIKEWKEDTIDFVRAKVAATNDSIELVRGQANEKVFNSEDSDEVESDLDRVSSLTLKDFYGNRAAYNLYREALTTPGRQVQNLAGSIVEYYLAQAYVQTFPKIDFSKLPKALMED